MRDAAIALYFMEIFLYTGVVHKFSDSVVVTVNKMVPMTFNTKMKAS